MSSSLSQLEDEISKLIVDTLNLEDINPDSIDRSMQLFGDGLGLDSIDALEIGAMLSKRYGIKIKSQSENAEMHFKSIETLAKYIAGLTQNSKTSGDSKS